MAVDTKVINRWLSFLKSVSVFSLIWLDSFSRKANFSLKVN